VTRLYCFEQIPESVKKLEVQVSSHELTFLAGEQQEDFVFKSLFIAFDLNFEKERDMKEDP